MPSPAWGTERSSLRKSAQIGTARVHMHADPCPARPVLSRGRNSRRSLAIALIIGLGACTLHASPAHADVSSWFTGGGGYGFQRSESSGNYDRATALSFSIGVGSTPVKSVVVGGLVRTTTFFTLGTDLDLSMRVATGSFARGQWGLALDLGPGWRSWGHGAPYGRFPLHAMVVAGGPWGMQLGVGGDFWNIGGAPYARGAVAILEIDLLRLTVMRQGATDQWWENPSPAGGHLK